MNLVEALLHYPALLYGSTIVFSMLFGSFFNVVIYRLPKMMETSWRTECQYILHGEEAALKEAEATKISLALPNSHCPKCQAPVKAWQNIPVVSYLLLRGKCASCAVAIGLRYPLIEITTAALAVVCLSQLGATPQALAVIFFSWILLILSMIDIDHQLLPDPLTLGLLWVGLAWNSLWGPVALMDAVWGAIAGYLILWSVYWAFKLLTGKEGMGFGDFKLLAALGAWMGWQSLPLIIILSSLVGAVVGGAMLAVKKQSQGTPIPFGPYLAAAGWIAMFWGEQITGSYLQFAGLR